MEILYHMNMGYPLLDEDSEVTIPSVEVRARDDHAQEDIANWMCIWKNRRVIIRKDAIITNSKVLMAKQASISPN